MIETYTQYLMSSASGGNSLSYEWLPDAWREASLRRVTVLATMRNVAVAGNPAYSCGAQVLFSELNNGVPVMEVAASNVPAPINGTSLIVQHWYPWEGNLRLDGGLQYNFFIQALPLFEMANTADWEFLMTIHWQIQIGV